MSSITDCLFVTVATQDFEIPQEFKAVYTYLETMRSRPSWQNTQYSDEAVLSGWKPKLGSG